MAKAEIQLQFYTPTSKQMVDVEQARGFAKQIGQLSRDAYHGLYIVRSTVTPVRFRFGATGVSYSNEGESGLGKRLLSHLAPAPSKDAIEKRAKDGKKSHNPTELSRPWIPVWSCTLGGANGPLTLIAEGVLGICLTGCYKASTDTGERSMLIVEDDGAQFAAVVRQFAEMFAACACGLGYRVRLLGAAPAAPSRQGHQGHKGKLR